MSDHEMELTRFGYQDNCRRAIRRRQLVTVLKVLSLFGLVILGMAIHFFTRP